MTEKLPPKDIIYRYTNGLCWDLAVALREITGLPVWAVFDGDGCEVHVFVFDENTSTAYDIRGKLSISKVISGPWRTGKSIGLWTREISRTKRDVAKAKTIANRYVMRVFSEQGG